MPFTGRLIAAGERLRSGGHASRVRQNAALTSFVAWFGHALRAAVKPAARRPPRR
jgi:hypothetical protein